MANDKIKKVNILNIKPNMILADDVVTKNGAVILARNTMLNNINYTKLKDNKIMYINVWSDSINEEAESFRNTTFTIEEQLKPVTEREEFKDFSQDYEKKVDQTEECMIAIGKGGDVDIDNLYKITTDIVNVVNCKSDIFCYLGYLKETDEHTYSHCVNVSVLCNIFSKWLGFEEEEIKNLTVAGLLHDIGKTKVDQEILNKKDKLTKEEFEEIKKHTTYGYRIISDKLIADEVKKAVLMHHEKIDGTGYPLGIKNNKIGKYAKIVAICDIYDAMTSDRVYRKKICPFEVIKSFEQSSFGLLDTQYLLTFLRNIAYTYVGSYVKLTNNEIGEVVFINRSQMSRPIVKTNSGFIDLSRDKTISIKHIV